MKTTTQTETIKSLQAKLLRAEQESETLRTRLAEEVARADQRSGIMMTEDGDNEVTFHDVVEMFRNGAFRKIRIAGIRADGAGIREYCFTAANGVPAQLNG